MPYQMDSLSDSRCPHLPQYLIQADGPHGVEVIAASDFGGQFDDLVFEPFVFRRPQVFGMLQKLRSIRSFFNAVFMFLLHIHI